jgi:CheY-like chemotaxis protein
MVLAVVDDFLFRSKIRTVARQAGVEVAFVQSSDEALARARAEGPRLIIFDLNSTKLDAIATIAAVRRDPALAPIATLAFASHVQVELIEEARQAGAGVVMPRSAFAAQLADILRSASDSPQPS